MAALVAALAIALAAPGAWAGTSSSAIQGTGQAVISDIVAHGNRRIPQETIRARMTTRPGDIYDQQTLERDFHSLWNTGYFDDLRFEREDTPKGVVIHVYVKEKPTIGDLKWVGLSSVTQSDVLDEFKKRKVNVSQESQYDPTRVMHARAVLKEMLASHGHQFAEVRPEVRQEGANRVALTFVIKEGPKVKVGKITFEGNKEVASRELRNAMKGMKPIGVPHSIFLENLWARTFDANRLSDDTELVREALQNRGFYKATVEYPTTQMKDTGHAGAHIPLLQHGKGKAVDIHFVVTEGDRYRISSIEFTGNKAVAVGHPEIFRRLFAIKDGDLFNIDKIRAGLKNLRDAYAQAGFINVSPQPDIIPDEDKKTIAIKINIDEGKQFFVRRIEFQGNTTTRDKVIRRELTLDEGSQYNEKSWEFSILRLNQLGYFDKLDAQKDTTIQKDETKGTVDLTVKVHEKQKNQIGLSGGVSGLEGSFIGVNYSTNNLLGKGETLTLALNLGNIAKSASFGFTEPYLFDRPIQTGFTVYGSKYNFNQAQQLNIFYGRNLNIPAAEQALLANYATNSIGFSVYASYAIPRTLKRIGLTYALDVTSITPFSTVSQFQFEQLQFRNINGPTALNGITTSHIQPSFSFNTVNSNFAPTAGHELLISSDIAGVGGNTRYVKPVIDWKQYIAMKGLRPRKKTEARPTHATTLAYHLQGGFITGYGGLGPAPYQRLLMGGENDVRGFDQRTISPVVFIPIRSDVPLVSPADPCLAPGATTACPSAGFGIPVNPANPRAGNVTVPVPTYEILPWVGGDTSGLANVEYNIEIIPNHVVLSAFTDVGLSGLARASQVRVAGSTLQQLNSTTFGCPTFVIGTGCTGGNTMSFTGDASIISATNWKPRMSNGLELKLLLPILNAPFRVFYAYNSMRLDTLIASPNLLTRSMFPVGGTGDASFLRTQSTFGPSYRIQEPLKTFRFTVATTF